jgi:hypothetical protein
MLELKKKTRTESERLDSRPVGWARKSTMVPLRLRRV